MNEGNETDMCKQHPGPGLHAPCEVWFEFMERACKNTSKLGLSYVSPHTRHVGPISVPPKTRRHTSFPALSVCGAVTHMCNKH